MVSPMATSACPAPSPPAAANRRAQRWGSSAGGSLAAGRRRSPPLGRQVQQHGRRDGRQDGDQHAQRPQRPAHAEDDGERQQAGRQRPRVGLPQVRHDGADLLEEAIGVDRDAEQLRQLADDDRHGQAGQVARAPAWTADRPRSPAGPPRPRRRSGRPSARACRPARSRAPGCAAAGGRTAAIIGPSDEVRPQHQPGRRPEHGVGEQADDGGVEPGDRRQAGQLRVGHPLRHQQGRQHQPRHHIPRQPRRLVGAHDAQARPQASARARRDGDAIGRVWPVIDLSQRRFR